jgi:hypothetical protein
MCIYVAYQYKCMTMLFRLTYLDSLGDDLSLTYFFKYLNPIQSLGSKFILQWIKKEYVFPHSIEVNT